MDKKELRSLMKKKRNALDFKQKKTMDNEVFLKLINSNYYKNCKNIFIFVSYNDEVDTHEIIKYSLKNNKTVTVPKVISAEKGMIAKQITSINDLEAGAYGIKEPKEYCPVFNPKDIDLVIIPGLAFDLKGGRIGYGGGFYDRFLTAISATCPKIAIGYNFQLIDSVPMDPNDIKIDDIITN